MYQKIAIILIIFTFVINEIKADNPPPPALPSLEQALPQAEQNHVKKPSAWQKLKNLVGLGKEETAQLSEDDKNKQSQNQQENKENETENFKDIEEKLKAMSEDAENMPPHTNSEILSKNQDEIEKIAPHLEQTPSTSKTNNSSPESTLPPLPDMEGMGNKDNEDEISDELFKNFDKKIEAAEDEGIKLQTPETSESNINKEKEENLPFANKAIEQPSTQNDTSTAPDAGENIQLQDHINITNLEKSLPLPVSAEDASSQAPIPLATPSKDTILSTEKKPAENQDIKLKDDTQKTILKAEKALTRADEAMVKDQAGNQTNASNMTDSSKVTKYKEIIEQRETKRIKELPAIPQKELTPPAAANSALNIENDPTLLKFVNDEVKVLTLNNDDIVLGKLTETAKLELMDMSSYVKIFWQNYEHKINSAAKQSVDNFINTYDEKFNSEKTISDNEAEYHIFNEAKLALKSADVNKFIKLINNLKTLNMVDRENNTLLHYASQIGNYPAAEILVMKGINLNLRNKHNLTALSIAKQYKKHDIIHLLEAAGAQ